MSSRIRNYESQRGMKEENLPHADIRERHPRPGNESHSNFRGGNNPSKWSDVEANDASKSDDWPSWESSPRDNNVKRDEDMNGMRHKLPAGPTFDGRLQQRHIHPLDDSWSQPQRVRGSARNQSRDRDGSRSPRRSRSRSRSRGKVRGRSRSRSWDRGEGGGRRRSKSPFHDDRHESYDNVDRVTGLRLSSRVCRPEYEGASRYGDSRASDDKVSRYGDNRNSADRPRNRVSDGPRRYNVEDKPPVRDNMKDTFCCKEFLKGTCRFGASCRYPHHVASGDNLYRGNTNASYNHDGKGPPNRSGKVPCKYFLIGKCHREDCRFSHDAPISEGVDGRSRDDRLGHIADEKNKSWNGPTWDGPTWDEVTPGLSNTAKSTGRRENSFHNPNPHDSANYEKRANVKNKSWDGPTWDDVNASDLSDIAKSTRQHGTSVRNQNSYDATAYDNKHMDDKNMSWNGPSWDETSAPGLSDATKSVELGERSVGNIETHHSGAREGHGWESNSGPMDRQEWNDKSVERNEYISLGSNTDTYMGRNDFMSKKNLDINEEVQISFDHSQSLTFNGTSMPSHERNKMLDASGHEVASTAMQSHVSESSYKYGRENPATFDDSNVLDVDMVSEDSTYPIITPNQVFAQSGHSTGYQSQSNLGGNEQCDPTISLNPLNMPNADFCGSVHSIYPPLTQPIESRINGNEAGEVSETVVSSNQVAQIADLPAILNQISQNGQLPQIIASLKPNNGVGSVQYFPTSVSVVPPVNPTFALPSTDMQSKEQYDLARKIMGIDDVPTGEEHQKSPRSKKLGRGGSEEDKNVAEKSKHEQERIQAANSDARGNGEEGSNSNDEKTMRLFKIALIDFVKEILKPTWKEGGVSREVHKAVVRKVVDKVTSAVQGIQIPRTPEKIEQYLAFSKPKITKLVAAYVERLSKATDA